MIIKCPECGHQVSDKAPVCPSCGVEIAGHVVKCPHCGEIYLKADEICPNCHQPQTASTEDLRQEEEEYAQTDHQQEQAPVQQEWQREDQPAEAPSSPLWTKRNPSPLPRRSSRRCVRLPRTRVTSSRQATNSSRRIQITRASNRNRRRTRRRRTSTSRCWSRWPLRSSPASCSSISTKTARPTRSATTSRALCKVRMPTSCNSTSPTTSRRRPSPTFRRHANCSPRCRASRTIGPTWRSRTRGRAMRLSQGTS